MKVEVLLPQWGMGMSEGTVVEWKKAVGDKVTEGDIIADIEAEKATQELESPATGVITEIRVKVNEEGRPEGGLQMAERTLTGELGSFGEAVVPFNRRKTFDRENDCVPEIDDAQLPASLASSITFHVARTR